jgi:hypothetical protein
MQDGPLDMRMDNESGQSAAQWLARASEREIADVLFQLGEEKVLASRRARDYRCSHRNADHDDAPARGDRCFRRADARTRQASCDADFPGDRIHINGELDGSRDRAAARPSTCSRREAGCASSAFIRSKIAWSNVSCAAKRRVIRVRRVAGGAAARAAAPCD